MPGMKEKESSKKGFACAMAYTEEPTQAKVGQRICQRLAMAIAWPIRAVRSYLRWRGSKMRSQGPPVLRQLLGRLVRREVRTETAFDCQRELKLVMPTHYPPTPGQRRQFELESWGSVWGGVRRASDLMGFR